jgi:hypothetical protein
MKKNNILIKSTLACLLMWCLFSVSFSATTQKWLDILQQLKDDWRTNDEIRVAMKDLWYNSNEYLWTWESSIKVIVSNSTSDSTNKTSKQWWDIINQFRKDWRTDDEIKQAMEDLWLDSSIYFPTNSNSLSYTELSTWSKYISRSCKPYNIEYISSLIAYTSPDLNKKEYFVSIDYLKRYVDSKNAQNAECYTNRSWITTPYADTSNWTDRYIAPNWKIYFISKINWLYTSNELSTQKSFSTIDELKNYIKTRNPLISMWWTPQTQKTISSTSTQTQNSSKTIYSEEDTQTNETGNDDNIIADLRKELFE